jgi:hypothetical protein
VCHWLWQRILQSALARNSALATPVAQFELAIQPFFNRRLTRDSCPAMSVVGILIWTGFWVFHINRLDFVKVPGREL